MQNEIMESIRQREAMYEDFERYWENFKKHSIFSRLIVDSMRSPVEMILQDLSPENILDVGCGMGSTMLRFRGLGFKTIGIDNSDSGIQLCQKKGLIKDRDVFQMDASKMSFAARSFDLVFSEGLFEHFLDYEPFLKEMARVSRRYILILQPDSYSLSGRLLNMAVSLLKKENPRELSYRVEDYVGVFKKHGYELVCRRPAAFGTFNALLFRRSRESVI